MIRTALAATLLITAPALADEWRVDHAASSVEFETTAFDTTVTGNFSDFDAAITLDPADLSTARIAAEVSVATADAGDGQVNSALAARSGFDPGAHPLAIFVSNNVRAAENGYEAHGTLTIKDESRDLVLPFTLAIEGDRAVADGEFLVRRADFGVGGSSWGSAASEVTVRLHIEADRVN